jgi:branched-chain amino acid transport system ATP-binding protein
VAHDPQPPITRPAVDPIADHTLPASAAPGTLQRSAAPLRLTVEAVSLTFGGVTALDGVSLDVHDGEVVAIIGPNGAGKTSLLNCISGLYRPQRGTILFHGAGGRTYDLTRRRPHQIASVGVARSFQNIELFSRMTVLENLMLGRHVRMRGGLLDAALYWWRQRPEEIAARWRVEKIIDFLEIEGIRHRPVGTLAYGLQKRVELGRALALDPELLLLDEPMAGMNAEEKEDMARFVLDLGEEWGITIALIEHDMGVVMDLSDWVVVLDFGKVIAAGTPDQVRADPEVIRAYLGDEGLAADRGAQA